jgi:hypothetical protein
MNDRELLEMAAKAAGVVQCRTDSGEIFYHSGRDHPWDPLTDDGDALRLAVSLGLIIDVRYGDKPGANTVCVNYWPKGSTAPYLSVSEYSEDQLTATRRAIVRAAAEIGRNM